MYSLEFLFEKDGRTHEMLLHYMRPSKEREPANRTISVAEAQLFACRTLQHGQLRRQRSLQRSPCGSFRDQPQPFARSPRFRPRHPALAAPDLAFSQLLPRAHIRAEVQPLLLPEPLLSLPLAQMRELQRLRVLAPLGPPPLALDPQMAVLLAPERLQALPLPELAPRPQARRLVLDLPWFQ